MRIVTVLGVIISGVTIGAAAVLAPLSMGAQPTSGAATGWMAGLNESAAGVVRSIVATVSTPPRDVSGETVRSSAESDVTVPSVAGVRGAPISVAAEGAKPGTLAAETVVGADGVAKRVAVALENGGGRKQTSSKPAGEEARVDLVRDIQRELKRVGCYDGDMDGSWGPNSKRAIATFTERVNASLSIEEPDFILLTLLQGHAGQACGASCPAGQTAATGAAGSPTGRCVPNGVLAQTNKPAKERVTQQRDASVAKNGRVNQVPAVSDTKVEQMAATGAGVAAVGSAWAAQVIVEPSTALTPTEKAKSAVASLEPAAVARSARSAEAPAPAPLPGRMAIGAPVPINGAAEQPAPGASLAPDVATAVRKPSAVAKRVAAIGKSDDTPDDSADVATPAQDVPKAKAGVAPKQGKAQAGTNESVRSATVLRALDQPAPVARVVRRPQQVVTVQRPPPVRIYQAPSYVRGPTTAWRGDSKAARQRRMVYDLFQRPDRN
jgi:hypothetical protein